MAGTAVGAREALRSVGVGEFLLDPFLLRFNQIILLHMAEIEPGKSRLREPTSPKSDFAM